MKRFEQKKHSENEKNEEENPNYIELDRMVDLCYSFILVLENKDLLHIIFELLSDKRKLYLCLTCKCFSKMRPIFNKKIYKQSSIINSDFYDCFSKISHVEVLEYPSQIETIVVDDVFAGIITDLYNFPVRSYLIGFFLPYKLRHLQIDLKKKINLYIKNMIHLEILTLKYVKQGSDIGELPPNLRELTIGYDLRKIPFEFPGRLEKIIFESGSGYLELKNTFPESLRKIEISRKLILPQNFEWPSKLESLKYGDIGSVNGIFEDNVDLPDTLVDLRLPSCFDKDISKLPPKLESLDLGLVYGGNSSEFFPDSLKKLNWLCGERKNMCLKKFTALEELTIFKLDLKSIGKSFPSGLKRLKLKNCFEEVETENDFLKNFYEKITPSITHLEIGIFFDEKINCVFLKNIKKLVLRGRYNTDLDLGDMMHLEKLFVGHNFNKKIVSLPESLKTLIIGNKYNRPSEFVSTLTNLRKLKLGTYFDNILELPPSLKKLKFGQKFNQKLNFPEDSRLRKLKLSKKYSHPLVFPPKLKKLDCYDHFYRNTLDFGKCNLKILVKRDFHNKKEHYVVSKWGKPIDPIFYKKNK